MYVHIYVCTFIYKILHTYVRICTYIKNIHIWYRDLLVLMERLAELEQQALRELVDPRDTKVCVDPQAIRELRELEDHLVQLVLKETKYTHVYVK